MIPNTFIELSSFPVSKNNKVDKKKLVENYLYSIKNNHKKIEKESKGQILNIEKLLKEIWEDVLDLHSIKTDDNYFVVGGDSLSAINLIARIENELSVEISVKDIFDYPTIESLAKVIKRRNSKEKDDD